MRLTLFNSRSSAPTSPQVRQLPRAEVWTGLALALIVAVTLALRFSNLDTLGYSNHYYTAGIESMLQSWRNFFFVAAEPGGSVSIDKPPLAALVGIGAAILWRIAGGDPGWRSGCCL